MKELLNSEVNLVSGAGVDTVGGRNPIETGTVVDPDPNKRPNIMSDKEFSDMLHSLFGKLFP